MMNNSQRKIESTSAAMRAHPRFGPMGAMSKRLLLVLLHVVLALGMRQFSILSTVHALVVFAIGFYSALTADDVKKVIPVAAYIAGAEVLWRMTDARIFYEFGKYATIAILIIALLRIRRIKHLGTPLLFFILLTPSIILTVDALGWSERAREFISFNLSGPLAAAICILFFSQVKMALSEMKDWVWPAVYPILGILTLAAYNTITATEIAFTSESSFVTSGGFGPNQVSAALSMGALLLVMLAITQEGKGGRFWMMLFSLALLVQSFLTFSRGGIYNFGIAIAGAILHLLGKPDRFIKGLFILLIVGAILVGLFFPQLEEFTGGMFSQRFLDTDLTSRESLVEADIKLFLDNPIFGVGPGLAYFFRPGVRVAAAHTEYSRLLAEHGVGGVLALLILLILLTQAYFKAPDATTRAWVVALGFWPSVEMAHAAMRIVAISFLLGMAMVNWRGVTQSKVQMDGEENVLNTSSSNYRLTTRIHSR